MFFHFRHSRGSSKTSGMDTLRLEEFKKFIVRSAPFSPVFKIVFSLVYRVKLTGTKGMNTSPPFFLFF